MNAILPHKVITCSAIDLEHDLTTISDRGTA